VRACVVWRGWRRCGELRNERAAAVSRLDEAALLERVFDLVPGTARHENIVGKVCCNKEDGSIWISVRLAGGETELRLLTFRPLPVEK